MLTFVVWTSGNGFGNLQKKVAFTPKLHSDISKGFFW